MSCEAILVFRRAIELRLELMNDGWCACDRPEGRR